LTEENDAVAVIVSEETGHISLALDGHIERNLTPEALRERMRTLVMLRRSGGRQSGARAYDV
jgi:diadenylate cyclase